MTWDCSRAHRRGTSDRRSAAARGPQASTAAAWALLALLTACAAPPKPPPGLLETLDRPAESALLAGMRAYDDGQYPQAEQQLQAALAAGLAAPRDQAAAHKLLAFVYCTSQRLDACEQAFRAARGADANFTLGRGEANHPIWGPVYRKLTGG